MCHFKARSRVKVKAHRFPAPEVVAPVVQHVVARPTVEEFVVFLFWGAKLHEDLRTCCDDLRLERKGG